MSDKAVTVAVGISILAFAAFGIRIVYGITELLIGG